MVRSSGRVRQHAADRGHVGLVHAAPAPHLALPLGRLLGEDVALVGAGALDAAAGARPEALRRAPLGLHLRHTCSCFCFSLTPGGPLRGRLKPRLSLVAAYAVAGLADGAFFGSAFGLAAAVFFSGTAFFFGASTITICRPSSLGNCSTTPTASRSFLTR